MILSVAKNSLIFSFWNFINRITNISKNITIGKNWQPVGFIRIKGKGKILIGNKVKVNSSIMSNPLGGNVCTILTALKNAEIIIGDESGLSNTVIFARNKISIGKNVLIGAGTCIYDNDFHPLSFQDRFMKKDPISKPINIDDGAFIGAHCIILKGVNIGKYSVIGAGSVVTHSIPDGEIWAGNPVKFIRKINISI